MPQIPLGQFAYRRGNGLVPSVRTENVYAETSPTNLKGGVDLLTRPALESFAVVGDGPIRCVFWEDDLFDDDALVVSGEELYRVASDGTVTLVGDVPGTGPVEIVARKLVGEPVEALIATGGPLLQTDGETVTTKTFPDDQDVISIGQLNGYFLALPADSHRIYYLDLVTGEFDGTRYISAERYPDNLAKIMVTADEVWGMGYASTEIFVPTGVDTDENPPLQRVEGRLYKKGVLSAATVVEADNTVFWVGTSKDAGLVVYRADAQPVVVSTPDISERLARAVPAEMRAWAFGVAGHSFYVLALGAEGTWVYDISSPRWVEWKSYARDQWRAHVGRGCWAGSVIAGDDEDGILWRLSETATTDEGEPIVQVFTAGVSVDGRVANPSLSIDCAVGQGDGIIRLRTSDDQGRTWTQQEDKRLIIGRYDQRARWNRLGTTRPPARIYEWTISDPVRLRVSGARVNDPY